MEFENAWRVSQWGYGEGADRIPLYVFSVPAKTLVGEAKIYRRRPGREDGYQRELLSVRLGKGKLGVPGYLLHQMGIFPTSILLNIRKEDAEIRFEEKDKVADNIAIGKLIVPEGVTWYVVDGQHRLEGLKIAMRERPELEDYPVLLTVTNENAFYEMLIFYIVNSRVKSVPTDLAYRLLQRMLYEAPRWVKNIMTRVERRKGIAATIVDYLNTEDNSPFKGKIREVGEPQKPWHVTEDGTLTRYVTIVLKERIFEGMYDYDVAQLLISYWSAIERVYPNCFRNPKDYALLDTLGLSSMSRLFPVIYGYCGRDGNTSSENMERYLRYLLEGVKEDRLDPDFRRPIIEMWWHKTDGPGIIRGTGEKHYSWIAEQFAEKIALVIAHLRISSDT